MTTQPLQPTRRSALVDQVITQLRTKITSGEWGVGEKIPTEPELVAALGVGRNTVREAVRALAHAGLLDSRQGSGTYVRAASEMSGAVSRRVAAAGVREVFEVRRGLEHQAARLAAMRRTAADLTELDEALDVRDAAWSSGDVAAFVEADAVFHTLVVSAAHNALLDDLYDDLGSAVRDALARDLDERLDAEYVDHRGLVDAIRAQDADRAGREATFFLDETIQRRG